MGMNEAPFGPIGMKLCPGCLKFRGASFGRGAMGPGGWGVGEKLKMCHVMGHYFLNFEKMAKKVARK